MRSRLKLALGSLAVGVVVGVAVMLVSRAFSGEGSDEPDHTIRAEIAGLPGSGPLDGRARVPEGFSPDMLLKHMCGVDPSSPYANGVPRDEECRFLAAIGTGGIPPGRVHTRGT